MPNPTTTTQTVPPQPNAVQTLGVQTVAAQPVNAEALETFQVEANYELFLEDRLGRYGF